MRAVTLAAAGAAVIGSVSASSHVENMHAQLHNKVARDTWLDWNSTSVDPVDGAKTTTTGWGSKPVGPATTSTSSSSTKHGGWGSKPVDPATTSTTTKAPAKTTSSSTTEEENWEDWTSSSSTTTTSKKPVDPATTSSSSEDYPWADWESSTSSKPVDPASTSSIEDPSWADWESSTSSKPVDPVTSKTVDPDHTWVDWVEPTTTVTLKSTVTDTKYVEPVTTSSVADASTWADWESSAAVTSKPVAPVTSILTSTIVPGWSASGWFGPSWAVEPGSCAVSVITSYGLPTCK